MFHHTPFSKYSDLNFKDLRKWYLKEFTAGIRGPLVSEEVVEGGVLPFRVCDVHGELFYEGLHYTLDAHSYCRVSANSISTPEFHIERDPNRVYVRASVQPKDVENLECLAFESVDGVVKITVKTGRDTPRWLKVVVKGTDYPLFWEGGTLVFRGDACLDDFQTIEDVVYKSEYINLGISHGLVLLDPEKAIFA